MFQWIKKTTAFILLVIFSLTQSGWSAESIQMIDGQLQPVSDPFSSEIATKQLPSEPVDFLADEGPLSLPEVPALPPARVSFSSTAGLTATSVTTLPGTPRPYLAAGTTAATVIQNPTSNLIQLNYSADSPSEFSGFDVSFDNASTSVVETRSITALSYLTLGLKGEVATVRLQVEDVNGVKDEIDLAGVSSVTEKFWRIPITSLSSLLDKSKIKFIRFLVSPANASISSGTGKLFVRANGLNLSAPAVPVVTVPVFTNQSPLTLSGTKEAHTSVLVNGVEVVGRNESTTWTIQLPLAVEGMNTFYVIAKNTLGKASGVKTLSITKDTVIPTGGININSGAAYVRSRTVTLNLSARDNKSGIAKMSFSIDGKNWSAPEVYRTSKSFLLPDGDGAKTVYVKYFDRAGNESASYFKSIVLDLLPPSGTMRVGDGSGFVNSRNVVLNLNAQDLGVGVSKMSFSHNGSTWTTAENYAQTKNWILAAGDGAKKVYARFLDKAGRWSVPVLVNVMLDSVKPAGAININFGDVYARSNSVTLNLSASDVGGGIGGMSFSTDGSIWSAPENYSASKSFVLPDGDGTKTVFVKYFDKAGNASAVYSKSIHLDTVAPEAGVILFDGKTVTRELSGSAAFSASDSGSGLEAVRYSLDQGATWTEWGGFISQRSIDLPAGDGRKEIIYEARDAAGNISSITRSITVDQTAPILEVLTSASVVRVGVWVVEYLSDGVLKTKSYQLNSGTNALNLSETDEAGNTSSLSFNVEYEREWDIVLENGALQHFEEGILKYEISLETPAEERGETDETQAVEMFAAPPSEEMAAAATNSLPAIHVYSGDDLQAAIDGAQFGQTVLLHTGSYLGHFVLKAGVSLIGENRDTVILHGNFETNKDVITAMGNNRIENLTVTGGGKYYWGPSSAINVQGDHVQILSSKISGNKDYGIYISADVSDVVIENNLIRGNNVGVQLPKNGNQIRFNTLVQNSIAVNILNGTSPIVENNIIADNTYQSIYEFGWGLVPTNGRAVVRNNTVFNNPEKGGAYGLNLPPAMETRDGTNWSQGNVLQNPQFVNPVAGDFSVQFGSPAFSRGAFVPEAWEKAAARSAQFNLASVIQEVKVNNVAAGYRVVYPAGTIETFMNDGTETLDTAGPVIEISTQNPKLVNQAEYDLVFTVDGSPQTKRFTLTEGDNLFTIEASDELGNRTVREFRVTLDTVPPQGALALNGYVSNNYFYDFPLTLNLSAVDQNSTVQSVRLSLDGGVKWTAWADFQTARTISWQEALSLYDYFGTDEVNFVAEVKDAAGNVGRATMTSTRDAEFPQGTISINNGLTFTQSREVTLSLTATDSISGVRGIHLIQYANDGSTFYDSGLIDFVTSKTIQLPPGDGLKTIQYGICDWAACIYKTAQINLDTTSPLIVLNTQIPTSTNNPNFVVDYTVDGVAKQKSFILVEGENNLSITETDSAGNTAIKEIKINYLLTGDRQIVGGGLQHFEAGELQYQINADGSRVDFAPDASIESYSFGSVQNNAEVLMIDQPQNELQIFNSSNQILKTVSALKPSAPNLSNALKVNLQDGVEAYYENGVLKEVRTSTGLRMFDLVLSTSAASNQTPEILDASIAYSDGSVDIIWNKNLVRKFAAGGTIVDVLPNGKVGREITGAVEQTYIDVYSSNGTFAGLKIVSNQGDEVVYDEKGILKSAVGADGKRFIYDRAQTANGYLLTLNSTLSSGPSAQSLIEGQYSLTGEVARLEFHNGSQISFENGKVKSAVNSEGDVIDYVPLLTNGLQQGLSVVRDEATFQYDQNGFLRQIQTQNGTISREKQDTNNDGILNDEDTVKLLLEWAGAYKLTDFELDGDGKILNGVIETREGIKQKIENGILKEFETADGRRYIVENQEARLEEWKFKDGLVVKYGGVGISEILFPDGKKLTQIGLTAAKEIEKYTETFPDGTQKFYENGWLVKFVSGDGVQILYGSDHRANKVILADGVEKLIEHQFDASGNWIGLKVRDGDSVFSYAADAKLTGLLISGLYADVRDGEIEKLFTRFGEVTNPVWNENSQLQGDIALVDGRKLTLADGKLARITMPDSTTIDYQNGRISRVENEEGTYNLTYVMSGAELLDVKVNWQLKSTAPFSELITESVPLIFEGDAKPASDVEKFGSYLTLDGSGDYLSVSDSPDWDFGTGDFTIDFNFFQNKPVYHGEYFFTKNGELDLRVVSDRLYLYRDGLPTDMGVWTDQVGAWRHIALVRLNGVVSIYLDGKLAGRQPFSKDIQGNAAFNFGNGQLGGAIDELRISSVARWTSDFAPPEQEYSIDANTLFLHHFQQLGKFNSKYDGQPLNVQTTSVTAVGDADVISGAALFDGAGDSLKVSALSGLSFGANDFTIEARIKPEAIIYGNGNEKAIASEYRDGGTGWIFAVDPYNNRMMIYKDGWNRAIVNLNAGLQFKIGEWTDVAVVRVGNKIKFFFDGIQQGLDYDVSSWIFSGAGDPLQIGQYGSSSGAFKGWMDELRISKGVARYSQNYTIASQPFEADAHTIFIDHFDQLNQAQSVPSPVIASAGGDAKVYAPQAVWGDAVYLDGKGDAIKSYDSGLLSFGKKDFTVDMRVNFEQARDGERYTLLSRGDGMEFRFMRETNNRLELYLMGSVYDFDFFKPETGRWYQLALVRKSGQLKLYVDGVANSVQFSAPQDMVFSDASPAKIGAWYSDNRNAFAGSVDELRISDIARWDANFTSSAAEYQVDKNTRFLHHFNDLDRAESGREILKYGIVDVGETFQGAVTQLAGNAKFGTAGLGFNAANQTFMKVPDINLEGSDYTLEGWFQASSSTLSGAGVFGQQNQNVTNYAGLYVDWDGKLTYEIRRNSQNLITLKASQSINYSQKHHFAVVKDGNVVKIFVDGVLAAQGTVADPAMPDFDEVDFTLGKYSFAGYTSFYGWTGSVDEFRISDRARYESNFSAATQAFDVDQSTLFLHHGEGSGLKAGVDFKQPSGEMSLSRYLLENPDSKFTQIISSRPVDDVFQNTVYQLLNSFLPRSFTVSGNVSLSSDNKSFVFDGSGDYISVNGGNFDFASQDFTIEAKVNIEPSLDAQTLVSDYWEGNGWIVLMNPAARTVHIYDDGWGLISFNTSVWEADRDYEIALVRKGNQILFFKDGVMEGGAQTSDPRYVGNPSQPLSIGRYQQQAYMKGGIDRICISSGVARYTQNYTPPSAYQRDANTALLLEFSEQEMNQQKEVVPFTDSAVLGKIDLNNWVIDENRGYVEAVTGILDPNLSGIYTGDSTFNNGLISRGYRVRRNDDLAALVTDLRDMDGDQDLDRIFLDSSNQYWWIQRFENGIFQSPEKWDGITLLDATYTYDAPYVMRGYEGRHPVVLVDLIDVNGDNLPDRVLSNWHYAEPQWQVQLNNGHGFDAAETWGLGLQPASQYNFQATYAIEVRDDLGSHAGIYSVQPLIADLIDIDGDRIPDRVVRPLASPTPGADPYDHWFFQKGNGHGFEDALIWEGVDHSFDSDPKTGGAIDWHIKNEYGQINVGDIQDLNGDNLSDRVLLKRKNPSDSNSDFDWYWQKNNGHGFEPAALWDDSIRSIPFAPGSGFGTGLQFFSRLWDNERWIFSDLKDVTGDGKPDRISLDSFSLDVNQKHSTWYVEVNNGAGFNAAVAWTGIEGENLQQTSISQENSDFFAYGTDAQPYFTKVTSDLRDINGDAIADRIYFKEGTNEWRIQYGTGSGFLPSQPMGIQSVSAKAITDHYDYVHVSLRSDDAVLAQQGKVVVKLLDANNAVVQTWDISKPGSGWKDHYLKLDASKANGRYLSMEWQFDAGVSPSVAPQILVEDIGLTAFRPDASLEWLDYLLTDAALVDQAHAAANDSLISKLGGVAGAASALDWKTLLSADKLITFNAEGAIAGTEKLNGETTTVVESPTGSTVTTTRLDGTVTQTTIPSSAASSSLTQTIVNNNGTPNDITDDYTETATIAYDRIRSVTRENENKQPLQYSYEFDSLGREITTIYDPDSKTTEKYRVFETPNGKESKLIVRIDANGVETRFEYDERARLTASVIYYKGRERERFTHLEAGNNQSSVRLDNGTVETYDSQGRILSHTTIEGYTYTHEFAPQRDAVTTTQTETFVICDPVQDDCSAVPVNERTLIFDIPYIELVPCTVNCEEIHRVSLDSFTDLNGNRATYDGSQVATVSLKDGTVVLIHSWAESVYSETSERSYSPKEVTVIHADGSVTEFKNGKPFSVETSSGREISIEPDLEASTSERTVLVNPSSAAEFHYSEALKLWNDLVLTQVQKFTPPSDLPVETEYTKQGVVLNRLFAEGSRQIFDADGKLTDIYAENGAAWVRYDYDQDGKLIDIDLDGSRRDLDLRASELRAQMAVEKQKALSLAAEREQVLNETIEGEYLVQRDRLLKLKNEVESQKSKLISIPARGSARGMIAGAMNQIQAGLAQINRALTQLAEQRAQSLADVSQAARDLKAQIEAESNAGMADIAAKEAEIQRNILKQEISPVVFEWYRSILGRHPSDVEYDAEVAQANYATGSFDVAALKARLEASPEKAVRLAEVNAIKAAVRNQLQSYLAMTAEQKMAYQASLGLGDYSNFIVSLSDDEAQKILTWLDGGSLHFGQSAFIALEALLEDSGLPACHSGLDPESSCYSRINLARDLIMMDILTGTITELETGDLVLSMFSLNLYAKRFGLNLSPLELNWDSLKSLVVSLQSSVDAQKRVIAHIDGNHYIIITNITTRVVDGKTIEEVHYTDPGAGPENDLDQLVLSKEDFLEAWTAKKLQVTENGQNRLESFGYILAPRAPPIGTESHPALDAGSFRTLTAPEQMQIRGAFFPIIFVAIAAVVAVIVSAVAAVVSAIVAIIVAVVSAIGALVSGIFSAVAFFGGQLMAGLGALFNGFAAAVANLGASLTTSAFWVSAGQTLLTGFGISLGLQGVGYVLNAFGVSPKITGTLIASGKIIGGIALVATGAGAGLGLSLIGSGTTDLLSLHTNLSSSTISMISLGSQVLGSFAGGFGGPGGFSWADGLALLKTSIPSLAMDLSATGIEMLGSSLGWDARLTGLASFAVGATVGGIGSGLTNGKSFLDSVNLGLKQGIAGAVSYGVNLGLSEAGLPPIASGFLSGILGGMIGGALGGSNSTVGSKEEAGQSLLGRITDNVKKFGQGLMKAVGGVISLGADIIQRGYEAVKNTFTGLFSRETQEVLYGASTAGGVGVGAGWVKVSYTENFDANDNLTSVVEIYQNGAGDKVTMVGGLQTGNFTIQRQMANGDLFQEVYEGVSRGVEGGFGWSNIAFAEEIGDGIIKTEFNGYGMKSLSFENDGHVFYSISSKDQSPLLFDQRGDLLSRGAVQVWDHQSNIKLDLELGSIKQIIVPGGEVINLEDNERKLLAQYVLANGIRNFNPPGVSPQSMLSIKDALAADGIDQNHVHLVPLFEGSDPILDTVTDIWMWLEDAKGKYNVLTGRIAQDLEQYYSQLSLQDLQGEQVVMAYSGSANGTLKAIAQNPHLPVDTVVMWGGPILNPPADFSQNTEIDRIINIWGSEDEIRKWSGSDLSGLIGKQNFSGVETINIMVEGARHEDVWYADSKWQGQSSPEAKELNRRVAKFIGNLLIEARDPIELQRRLDGLTQKDGVYIIKEEDLPQ